MNNILSEISRLGIQPAYFHVMDTNPNNLPYHNNYHLQQVIKFVLIGANYYKVSDSDRRMLAIAAIFHDYKHSGSGKNDDINIKIAIDSFIDFNLDIKKFGDFSSYFSEEECDVIIGLIKATRYPYVIEAETLLQKIIRDSDILQGIFAKDYINSVTLAIAKENGIPQDKMLNNQIQFLESTKFCTEWATNMYLQELPNAIEKINKAIEKIR